MDFATQSRGGAATRRTLAAVLVAAATIPVVVIASSARAAPAAAHAWGSNTDGELGNGTTQSSDVPVAVTGVYGVTSVAGGGHHSLALRVDGTVVGWGENFDGQLGDGTTRSSDVPVPVNGLSEAVAISAGSRFSLALLKNGTVMAWGENSSGQLGNGTTTNSDTPLPVRGLTEVAAISAGHSFSLARLKDGKVMAWGENLYGQLGDGSREPSDVPVAASGLSTVTAIAAGSWHSLAQLSNGMVMAWGSNEYGQLGNGGETDTDVPLAVINLSGVGAVAAGRSHSLAILSNGAVMAWGGNVAGQLGDGSHTGPEQCGVPRVFACSRTPVATDGLSRVSAVSAHGDHSMALLGDRTIMAWGQNTSGQLGNGTTGPEACGGGSCSAIPVAVCQEGPQLPCPTGPALRDVESIAAGEDHSLAVVETPSNIPELGRCVKVSSGGAYKGTSPRCVALSSTHTGHFEWLPGPGPKRRFTDELGELKLETVGKDKLDCVVARLEGEYTGPKTATISHVMLEGCRNITMNASCQTDALKEGLIESSEPLERQLGFIASGEQPSVGWDLEPKPPALSLVSFECGSGGHTAALALEGSVIGRSIPIDEMVSAFHLSYEQTAGIQIPEFFEGGPRQPLTLTTTSMAGVKTSAQAGLQAKGVRTDEEALEVKAKA